MQFECPNCGNPIRVRDEYVGRKTRCHQCNEKVTIPEPESDIEFVKPVSATRKVAEEEPVDEDILEKYDEFRCKSCQHVFNAAVLKRKQEKACMYCGGELRPRKSTRRDGEKGQGSSGTWGAAVQAGGYTSHGWKGDTLHEHRVGIMKHARAEPPGSGLLGPKWCAYHVIFTTRRILVFEMERDQAGIAGGLLGGSAAPAEHVREIEQLYRANDMRALRKLTGKNDYEFSVGELTHLREERGRLCLGTHDGTDFEFEVGEYAAGQVAQEMAPVVGKRPAIEFTGTEPTRTGSREVSALFDQALLTVREHLGAFSDGKLFVSPNIPDDKLATAVEAYGKGIAPDSVLLLFDATLFHGAKHGFCLTPEFLLWQNRSADKPGRKALTDIKAIACDPGSLLAPAKLLVDRDEIVLHETRHGREIGEKLTEIVRTLKDAALGSAVIAPPDTGPKVCPRCGRQLQETDRFCGNCGTQVGQG